MTPRQREHLCRIQERMHWSASDISDSELERERKQERQSRGAHSKELPSSSTEALYCAQDLPKIPTGTSASTIHASVTDINAKPINSIQELTITVCPCQSRWNDKDLKYPESLRVYYRRMRQWQGIWGDYQAERMRRCAAGTVAIDSENSDT